ALLALHGALPIVAPGQVDVLAGGRGEVECVKFRVEAGGLPGESWLRVAGETAVLVEQVVVVKPELGDRDGVDFDRDLAGDGAAVLAGGDEGVGGRLRGRDLARAGGVDRLAVEGDALGAGDAPGEGGSVSPDHARLVAAEAGL